MGPPIDDSNPELTVQPANVLPFPVPDQTSRMDPDDWMEAMLDGVEGLRIDLTRATPPDPVPDATVILVPSGWWGRQPLWAKVALVCAALGVAAFAVHRLRRLLLRRVEEIEQRVLAGQSQVLLAVKRNSMRILSREDERAVLLHRRIDDLPGAVAKARPTTAHYHRKQYVDRREYHSHTPERVIERVKPVQVERRVELQPIVQPTERSTEIREVPVDRIVQIPYVVQQQPVYLPPPKAKRAGKKTQKQTTGPRTQSRRATNAKKTKAKPTDLYKAWG